MLCLWLKVGFPSPSEHCTPSAGGVSHLSVFPAEDPHFSGPRGFALATSKSSRSIIPRWQPRDSTDPRVAWRVCPHGRMVFITCCTPGPFSWRQVSTLGPRSFPLDLFSQLESRPGHRLSSLGVCPVTGSLYPQGGPPPLILLQPGPPKSNSTPSCLEALCLVGRETLLPRKGHRGDMLQISHSFKKCHVQQESVTTVGSGGFRAFPVAQE